MQRYTGQLPRWVSLEMRMEMPMIMITIVIIRIVNRLLGVARLTARNLARRR